ncbi:Fic family protein [Citromicrobium bathyomarinum]
MNISQSEPFWLDLDDITSIHEEQIELHGGAHGIRDLGLVQSALGRARSLYEIGGEADVLVLAVRLGLGIAKNHGFIDGNKRAGAFAMIEFLGFNGYWLDMPNNTRLGRLFKLAVADRITEEDLIAELDSWIIEFA